ncbi:S-layer homology domain-containing protein [Aminipila terrae]|uniref:X-prolyl-dipeptidyl aminopeptidase n=1 Tax=Aminipila terrae TaxID=2697030 RepID=A0A6P1MJK2_9FIRM|nr:S-layer homology domain-containing protein [Aminipila terrae]QHI71796.1 X-prolyl-dipeptidyl aminopeptidase [Aminipila terrae]
MNAFDSFHQQPEIKPAVEQIIAASKDAGKERYIEYAPLGKSAEGRDIPFVIFAKSQGDVENYQKSTLPMMMEHPDQLINSIEKGEIGKYKPVIWFNNIHSDESNGVDAQIDMLRELATQDTITFKSVSSTVKGKDKDGNDYGNVGTGDKEDITLDVNELLDNYIVLFSLNNNPDGRFYNNRTMVSGFDPNRDVTYQTQIETATVFQAMAKWSPMIFNDFHGFVEDFLIEPCTPPHDPNFEYDLLMDSAIEHANAMGKAGIGMDGGYNHYIIPMFDYGQGWDDGAPMYAAVLSQMHGAVGHTVEIPELNQKSNDTFKCAGFGSLKYALDHKQKMFENQLTIYDRGIKGIDDKGVDKYLVNAKGESIGRARGSNENFFPEYYVLPVDGKLQKNRLAAYEMAEYLIKNGVKVERTNTDVKIGDVTYPRGSYIVPMHQAKRGFANCVLYDGSDFSDFSAMYAEVTMCFPALRGFDKYEIRVADAFKGKTESVENVTIPATDIPSGADQIIIKNTNNDVIKAVNDLLANNKAVYMTYSKGQDFNKGDFIVLKDDLQSVRNKYFLELEPLKEKAIVKKIKEPKVYESGNELGYVLKELAFNLVDSYDNADIIADETGKELTEAMENKIKAGTSYVGVGGYGVYAMADSGLLPGLEIGSNGDSYEGVLKAVLDTDSVITGRYNENDVLYNNSASWIEKVPATAKVLASISDKEGFYTAGWWPNHDEVKGKAYIIQDQAEKGKITLFASHITNKGHPSHQFRLLANAIYDGMPGELTEIVGTNSAGGGSHKKHNGGTTTKDTTTPNTPVKDPAKEPAKDSAKDTASKTMPSDTRNHWSESSVKELIDLGAVSSYPDHTFKPDKNITRAELVTILVKALKIDISSDKVFADTQKHWAKDYIAAAEKYRIVSGYTANQFGPDDFVTREQMATMIMRALKLNSQAAKEIFGDQKEISDWAKDYISAAQNAKLISGYPDGSFHPKDSATRGEAAKVIVNAIKTTN